MTSISPDQIREFFYHSVPVISSKFFAKFGVKLLDFLKELVK